MLSLTGALLWLGCPLESIIRKDLVLPPFGSRTRRGGGVVRSKWVGPVLGEVAPSRTVGSWRGFFVFGPKLFIYET